MIHRTLLRLVNLSTIGLQKSNHLTRYAMYVRLKQILCTMQCERTLNISKSDYLCSLLGNAGEVVKADYPEVSLLDLPFPDDYFDAIVSDQVLEHVAGNPFDAIGESLRVLRTGGYMVHTTCLLQPIHGYSDDFWRYTPRALELMVKDKARIIEAAGWGNWLALLAVHFGMRSVLIPEVRWHPLNWIARLNSETRLMLVWIVAQKAAAQ